MGPQPKGQLKIVRQRIDGQYYVTGLFGWDNVGPAKEDADPQLVVKKLIKKRIAQLKRDMKRLTEVLTWETKVIEATPIGSNGDAATTAAIRSRLKGMY